MAHGTYRTYNNSPSNRMASQIIDKSTDASETFIPPHGGLRWPACLPESARGFPRYGAILWKVFGKTGPYHRPDDSGCAIGETKHCRGKQSIGHFEGGRDKIDQCGPLDQLISKLQKAFVEEGGLRERMTRARLAERAKQKSHLTASAVRDRRSLKSSSRYYCTDIVHSSRAKEKFRGFTPLQSADSGG